MILQLKDPQQSYIVRHNGSKQDGGERSNISFTDKKITKAEQNLLVN
jgi:hypothetical protein